METQFLDINALQVTSTNAFNKLNGAMVFANQKGKVLQKLFCCIASFL